jgi:hypothetical protein
VKVKVKIHAIYSLEPAQLTPAQHTILAHCIGLIERTNKNFPMGNNWPETILAAKSILGTAHIVTLESKTN